MKTRSNNQAETILLAATKVIAARGTGKLTIDAVAEQAGMSKGGVLYHFPSKDALIKGMLAELLKPLDEKLNDKPESSSLVAMLGSVDLGDDSERNMSLAILAASAEKPELLDPARTYYKTFAQGVRSESSDPEFATILMLALEGIRFMHMLDLVPWSTSQTNRTLKKMRQIAEEVTK